MKAAFQDGNWILHKNFSVRRSASDADIAKSVLDSACKHVMRLDCTGSAVFFDGSRNFRYGVYPEYKSNRGGHAGGEHDTEVDPKDMYSCLDAIFHLFKLVRFPIYQVDKFEADDLCSAAAVHHAKASKRNFSWIVNHDKDAFQTVTDRIHVFWPQVGKDPEKIFTDAAVWARTGFYPDNFAEFQILTGDGVDCIPAIVKPAVAKKILKEHGSLKKYFSTDEGRRFFLAHETELRRNKTLVRMDMSAWDPEYMNHDLSRLEDSRPAWNEFGRLPSSFYGLRACMNVSKKRSLF